MSRKLYFNMKSPNIINIIFMHKLKCSVGDEEKQEVKKGLMIIV